MATDDLLVNMIAFSSNVSVLSQSFLMEKILMEGNSTTIIHRRILVNVSFLSSLCLMGRKL